MGDGGSPRRPTCTDGLLMGLFILEQSQPTCQCQSRCSFGGQLYSVTRKASKPNRHSFFFFFVFQAYLLVCLQPV